MARLFLFAIGGSGARVVRSLVHLLAAGVRIPNCEAVVPVLIDPDTQNGDVVRTVELLKLYERLHRQLSDAKRERPDGFFAQPLLTLASLSSADAATSGLRDTFVYDFGGINKSFGEFLHRSSLSPDSGGLVDLLFSKASLDANLDLGFRGSPNVGSVVLNGLMESKEMRFLAQNLRADDRVFFVSSIFGGTGAAGFPLLVKNMRHEGPPLANPDVRKRMKAGALVLLPYFVLDQPSAAEIAQGANFIDSRSFVTKTKTALSYYAQHLKGVDATYYLGDEPGQPLANNPGKDAQRNAAHLIELVGALAPVHFMCLADPDISDRPLYHEFGLKAGGDPSDFDFAQLPDDLRATVARPLIRFHYFARYLTQHTPGETSNAAYANQIDLGARLKNDVALRDLNDFLTRYDGWLKELGLNRRHFRALRPDRTNFNEMVADKAPKTGGGLLGIGGDKGITPDVVKGQLNDAMGKLHHAKDAHPDERRAFQLLIAAFDAATEALVKEKLQYA